MKRRNWRWHERLTKKQREHLRKHMNTFTLTAFRDLRDKQREIAAKHYNDELWRVCAECDDIETRLINTGHLPWIERAGVVSKDYYDELKTKQRRTK